MAARTRKSATKKSAPKSKTRKTEKRTRARDTESSDEGGLQLPIQAETMHGVWAILSVAAGIFFTLAWFGIAGKVGTTLYIWLSALFGVGYVLVPISFGIIATVLFRSIEHEKVGALKIVGTVIFFLSGLGLVEILFDERGGLIGQLISSPLVFAIDVVASIVVLLALIIISLLISFDAHPQHAFPTFARLFGRNKEDAEEDDDEQYLEEEEVAAIAEVAAQADAVANEIAEEEEADPPAGGEQLQPKKSSGIFNFGGGDASPAIFNFATGSEGEYTPPPLSLLQKDKGKPSVGDVKASANTIKRTLQNFGISVEMDEVSIGPTVTRYAMKPAEGVRLAKIVSLQSNLELALAATPIRIEAPIPGKALVGIEVPNTTKSMLGLGSIFSDPEFQNSDKPLLVALGRDIAGQPHYANIAKMPHLLIAGATGAGKSVTVHDLIVSLLYRRGPRELRFMMVDPKRVELSVYNEIPHLLTPVITEPKKAILALKWLAKEMDRRYDVLEAEKVRDIGSYHANIFEPAKRKLEKNPPPPAGGEDGEAPDMPEPMPYIVAVIDEMADLMTSYPRELEAAVVRLAQMSRAVGIHLILSTQRPSVQVITGLIKANIPSRIALQVSSQIDSRTILDAGGAEKLLGAGDMLFLSGEMSKPRRIQAPYISEEEVKKVVKYLVDAHIDQLPDEIDFTEVTHDNTIFSSSVGSDDGDDDDLYEEAKRVIVEAKKGSTSFLQRKLRVGYARAARLMDLLEERGVVGPAEGSKPREVLGGASGNTDTDDEPLEDTDDSDEDEFDATYDETENDEDDRIR